MRRKSIEQLERELAEARTELESVREHEALRLGKIAVRAGLGATHLTDAELASILKELAAGSRDRTQEKENCEKQAHEKQTREKVPGKGYTRRLGPTDRAEKKAKALINAVNVESRRLDTREKIQLGGLVVKAGLRNADRAFLMGALASSAKHLDDAEFVAEMKRRGDRLLNPHKAKTR